MPKTKPASPPPTSIQLGPVTVTTGTDTPTRMALLLWGPPNAGKSVFAATAPGKKLWISIGDQEHVTVMHRPDVLVANLAALEIHQLFNQIQNDDPLGIDALLNEHTDISTVVIDSITALTFRALQKAVRDKVGAGRGFVPTMATPGISAYGARNGIVLETLTGFLRVTDKHGAHCIMTAHEADPVMIKDGSSEIIDYISVMLGGQIVNNVNWRLSEIWHINEVRGARFLSVRPNFKRKPMKTRMFDSGKSFKLMYDPDKPDDKQAHTIAKWYNAWADSGGQRQPLPGKNEDE